MKLLPRRNNSPPPANQNTAPTESKRARDERIVCTGSGEQREDTHAEKQRRAAAPSRRHRWAAHEDDDRVRLTMQAALLPSFNHIPPAGDLVRTCPRSGLIPGSRLLITSFTGMSIRGPHVRCAKPVTTPLTYTIY